MSKTADLTGTSPETEDENEGGGFLGPGDFLAWAERAKENSTEEKGVMTDITPEAEAVGVKGSTWFGTPFIAPPPSEILGEDSETTGAHSGGETNSTKDFSAGANEGNVILTPATPTTGPTTWDHLLASATVGTAGPPSTSMQPSVATSPIPDLDRNDAEFQVEGSDGASSNLEFHKNLLDGLLRLSPTVILSIAMAALIVFGVVLFFIASGGTPATPEKAVMGAAKSTVIENSASLSVNGVARSKVQGQSLKVSLKGSGVILFSKSISRAIVAMTVNSRNIALHEVYAGGTAYVHYPEITVIAPGKSWVTFPLSQTLTTASPLGATAASGNPSTLIPLLEERSSNATSLPSKNIDGANMAGYAVSFTAAQLQSLIHSPNLTLRIKATALKYAAKGLAMKVYVNGAGQLAQIDTTFTLKVEATATVAITFSETLSNFGEPVRDTIPNPTTVITFTHFLEQAALTHGAIGGGPTAGIIHTT